MHLTKHDANIRIIIVNKVSGGENLQNGPYKTAGRAKSGGKYEENLHHCSSIQYFSLFMMTMVWIHGQDDKESYLEKAFIVNDYTTFSDNLH